MKTKLFFLAIIFAGCSTSNVWKVTKPQSAREWKIFKFVDSMVVATMGLDSITYDWNKKVECDWKNGKATKHKFEIVNQR